MPIKLGQLLMKAGRINQNQLEEALRHQVVHGGKLGTNLIELGFISENELSLVLGHKLGVPFINHEQIIALSKTTTSLIPSEIADKYRVIPVENDNKRLALAMADPSDLEAIDAISFLTGMIIRPVVCPELLLVRLHEKFYGIKRKLRYAEMQLHPGKLEAPSIDNTNTGKEPEPENNEKSSADDEIREYEIPMFDNFEGFHHLEGDQFEELYLDSNYHSSLTLDQVSKDLAEAKDRDSIADTVLKFISIAFPVAAIVLVRSSNFTGWKADVRGEESQTFKDFIAPINEPSIFSTVLNSKIFFLGPAPENKINKEFSALLGARRPSSVLVIPIIIQDKVIAMLHIEGEADILASKINELNKLANKMSMSFEILILKNKILMS